MERRWVRSVVGHGGSAGGVGTRTWRESRRASGRRILFGLAALWLIVTSLAVTACGSDEEASAPAVELRVFAAASLTEAFTEVGDTFMGENPNVTVTFVFDSSSNLALQLQQGAAADVLATADERTMGEAADYVETPQVFATNRLAIVVAPGNPLGIEGLADLARPDLKVVLAAPEVPVGKYAVEALDAQAITVEPVSYEATVKAVATKVALGEADAGIVYVTDVTAADDEIDGVTIPDEQNLVATYPIAVVSASKAPDEAQAFVDFVLSAEGQQIMQSYGFQPPPDAR